MKSILVVSNDLDSFKIINTCFKPDYNIERVSTEILGRQNLETIRSEMVFIDLDILREMAPDENYKAALKLFWQIYPSLEIIVMAPQRKIRNAVKAVKAGASDYLTYPLTSEQVKLVFENINKANILHSEIDYLRDQVLEVESFELSKTNSPKVKKVFAQIGSVAPTKSTVLITGETGTGKSVIAKRIHQLSNRRDAQFIGVHCGAIPDTLIESEMFGHEKGAFTGAIRRKLGKFEIAKGGTIFLDEIGTITPSAQIKLLQVLQDGTFQRVGREGTLKTDVRVITATNADLKKMCDGGEFRKDLYYRLNVFPIEIPPLREREEDIPLFIAVFLNKLNKFSAKTIHSIHPQVLDALKKYHWPGNIRELENLVERAHILETTSLLTPESFPNELFESEANPVFVPTSESMTLAETRQRGITEIERNYLKDVLSRNKGKINESASDAGISPRQLNKLMNKYGIRKEGFKT
ncbi:MAG: sigma-54 dependent transcriptional regulator [Desulfobacterales bacterium]|jgi:DNA-binding NtrC family response regulator